MKVSNSDHLHGYIGLGVQCKCRAKQEWLPWHHWWPRYTWPTLPCYVYEPANQTQLSTMVTYLGSKEESKVTDSIIHHRTVPHAADIWNQGGLLEEQKIISTYLTTHFTGKEPIGKNCKGVSMPVFPGLWLLTILWGKTYSLVPRPHKSQLKKSQPLHLDSWHSVIP